MKQSAKLMRDATEPKRNENKAGVPDQGTPASTRLARRPKSNPRRLIDTRGPEPTDAIDAVRLTVGRIGGPHGLGGEMRMALLTDVPDHLLELDHVYLGNSDEPVSLESVRFHGDLALVSFNGVNTPEDARKLGGLVVKIDGSDAKPLEEGEYFIYQLIGLRAITPEGDDIGVVVDLMETGANDVLVVALDGGGSAPNSAADLLIPNHPVYVHEINPAEGVIVVTKPVYPEDVS
jgi:16S rRNA processing protein RimM